MARVNRVASRSNANDPEYYLALLESKKNDPDTIKEAVRGFRTSLPEPLEIDELAAKLKVDPRTTRRWEEQGSPMRPGILIKFRALLPTAQDETTQIKRVIEKRTIGLITLGEMLQENKGKLQRVIVLTCSPLKEQYPGSSLRNEVVTSMLDGVKYVYVFPEDCPAVKESFEIFKNSLRDNQKGLAEYCTVPNNVRLFLEGTVFIICETKPEPENQKPDGSTFGYLYTDMKFTSTARQKGFGYLCVPLGDDLYDVIMRRLQQYTKII